jgi:acyl carrier protein phosphodiesterase
MNFLGHLYFSGDSPDLMIYNLLGDFIRGKDLSQYPKNLQEGIYLHRQIDHYIDHHPEVLKLANFFYPILPKVSGIAIDLFFDHVLAKNWSQYHTVPLPDFIERFYQSIKLQDLDEHPTFRYMLTKMQEKNWLFHYQFIEGLDKACNGVSRRISFENQLHKGKEVFEEHEEKITESFHLYMKSAIPYFKEIRSNLNNLV